MRARSPGPRIHLRPGKWLSDDHWRARCFVERRAAPAHCDRASVPDGPANFDPGRCDGEGRFADRTADTGGDSAVVGGAHHVRHFPAVFDGETCGFDTW